MSSISKKKVEQRRARQKRVRRNVRGTDEKPRLCVFRSLRYTYVQLISDESGRTLAAVSSRDLALETKKGLSSIEGAKAVGKRIAELAKEKAIKQVIFDRNGYVYHGRIAAVAAAAREGGLKL